MLWHNNGDAHSRAHKHRRTQPARTVNMNIEHWHLAREKPTHADRLSACRLLSFAEWTTEQHVCFQWAIHAQFIVGNDCKLAIQNTLLCIVYMARAVGSALNGLNVAFIPIYTLWAHNNTPPIFCKILIILNWTSSVNVASIAWLGSYLVSLLRSWHRCAW